MGRHSIWAVRGESFVTPPETRRDSSTSDRQAEIARLVNECMDRREAGEALPDLSRLWSYPTTLFINREGRVEKIYTGFNGPGTGKYFETLKKDFIRTIESLL